MKFTVSDETIQSCREDTEFDNFLFHLLKNDITQNELNLIDGAIVRTYKTFGITYDNDSLFDKDGRF